MGARKEKNLGSVQVKASLAYTICSIIQKGLSFLTLPIFTRLLTLEQYGQCSIYFSWSAIIAIITTLNLPYGTFSKAMVKFEDSREQYISTVQMICIVLTLFLLVLYIPLREYINRFLELPTFLVLILLAEIIANLAMQCWMGKARFEYRYKSVIILTLLTSLLMPAVGLIFVLLFEEKGYARIIGYALITVLVGTVFLVRNFIKGKSFFRKDMWKYAFGMNGVLIVYYLSQVIFNQSDRIMISHMLGMDQAALYSVAYNLAIILTFVVDAINNSYVPWLYGKIKEDKQQENKKISILLSILIAFLLLGIIALAPELIYVIAGKEYIEAKWVVAPIAMSLLLLFYSQQFINIEFYYEKKYLLVIAAIFAAVLNIGLNFWLIPIYGYVAAGYTTLISYFVFAVSNYLTVLFMMKKSKIENNIFNIPLMLAVLVVFIAIGFLAMFLYNYSIIRYVIIGVVLIAILAGSKWIIKLFKNMFKKQEGQNEVTQTENK